MARRPPRIVAARLKVWPPRGETYAYVRILCGYTYPSGQQCPVDLGRAKLIEREKGRDPGDPASYYTDHIAPVLYGGSGIEHLGIGELAPEFALEITEDTHVHDMLNRDGSPSDSEGLWIAVHVQSYRLVNEPDGTRYFDILLPHKGGLTGSYAARRWMPAALAIDLEERIDPGGHYGFNADRSTLGNVPTLPTTIRCPRCSTPERSTLNKVRPPTDDDLKPKRT